MLSFCGMRQIISIIKPNVVEKHSIQFNITINEFENLIKYSK